MSNDIFPTLRGLTWPVKRVMEFSNASDPAKSGYDTRVAFFRNPKWHWDLKYSYLLDDSTRSLDPWNPPNAYTASDFSTLQGFMMKHKNSWDDFLYYDPTDNFSLANPLPLWQDASSIYYSPLMRSIGSSGIAGSEDITDLNPNNFQLVSGGIQLYENGAPSTTTHAVTGPGLSIEGVGSCEGLFVEWFGTPTGPITADLYWFYRVHFEKDDDTEMDWFLGSPNRFALDSLKIETSRRAPQI